MSTCGRLESPVRRRRRSRRRVGNTSHYPLSSTAGRTAGQTPLYTVPNSASQRYVDDRDIYFTTSMPMVSDMTVSNGVGGTHALRYGYSQAMYQTHGRGFSGFRTIIEEDVSSGLRTTTTYNQKFPLISKVAEVVVNAMASTGTDAPITDEKYTWLCDLSSRTTACAPSNGTAAVVFPFLDEKDTYSYDPTVALQGGNQGQPKLARHRQDPCAVGLGFASERRGVWRRA